MDDMDALSHFDLDTLVATIIDVELTEEVHRKAISVLIKCDPIARNPFLVRVMKAIASRPSVYDHESMMALVDILATDPDPEATEIIRISAPWAHSSVGRAIDFVSDSYQPRWGRSLLTQYFRWHAWKLEIYAEALRRQDVTTLSWFHHG